MKYLKKIVGAIKWLLVFVVTNHWFYCITMPLISFGGVTTAMTMSDSGVRLFLLIGWPAVIYTDYLYQKMWFQTNWDHKKRHWWYFTWRGVLVVLYTISILYNTVNYVRSQIQPAPANNMMHHH